MSRPTIYLPVHNLKDVFFRHAGDTFRELVGLWESDGLVEIVYANNLYCWMHATDSSDGIVLYDRPTLEWWTRHQPTHYRMALFGNEVPPVQAVPRSFAWIFWGRNPALMASFEKHPLKTYSERKHNCVFLGKIENHVQQHYRRQHDWGIAVDDYTLVNGKKNPYSPKEYLEHLQDARFGLSLRGFGPKCNREIELLLFGTVPIVAPDCDMTRYFDPLIKGKHYFVAANPTECQRIIDTTSESTWAEMSRNCRDWYMRNASSKGSFYQTMRLIQTVNTSMLASRNPRPLLSAHSAPPKKLPDTKRVLIDMVFFDRPLSGISRVWTSLLRQLGTLISKDLYRDGDDERKTAAIEYVLLLRQNSTVPLDLTNKFAYIGDIPAFSYGNVAGDVNLMDRICESIEADIFVSTYYTYCRTVPCLVLIHDMIPEVFKFPVDAMWEQKKQCLENGQHFVSVSECSRRDFLRYHPEKSIDVVFNSFDPIVFEKTHEVLQDPTFVHKLHDRLSIPRDEPFVLTIIGNGNGYKNLKLIVETLHRPDNVIRNLVIVANTPRLSFPKPPNVNLILLNHLSDTDLGVLYATACAFIYPSQYEGFGLPVLEAFYFLCPVICCRNAGGIADIIGNDEAENLVWPVDYNRPDEVTAQMRHILTAPTRVIDYRTKRGLKRLSKFTVDRQITDWRNCIQKIFQPKEKMHPLKNIIMSDEIIEGQLTNKAPSEVQNEMSGVQSEISEASTGEQNGEQNGVQSEAPANIALIIQYFNCGDEERQAEYDFCINANLNNSAITEIHNMVEPNTVVPEFLKNHEKYREFKIMDRLTYKIAFEYANKFLIGRTVALANLDIFLDHNTDWRKAKGLNEMGIVLCLARHEFDGEAKSSKDKNLDNLAYATSQDAWIFQAPLHVKECDFTLGMLGCDSAIAHRLNASGYLPVNAQDDYKIHHYDICRGKTGENFIGHHEPNSERPEDRGYRLLPGFNRIQSVDKLIEGLKLGEMHKYLIVCDIMSNYIRLNNPK